MTQIPIQKEVIDKIAGQNKIANPGKASIREMRKMIQDVEHETGIRFVKMEMGIPGLPAPQVGVNAQIEALKSGVASIYPEIYGTADFKKEAARFVKNFLDIDVTPDCCVPTVGSMQAGFASFLTLTRYDAKKTKVLFIDPGFPVQKQQCRVLGIPMKAFDVYEYRGDKLRDKLEEELKDGDVACLIYSSPNNPAWFCFTEHELKIIGEMANKYGVVVMEDSAYFLMDFRKDYSVPGQPPFQPTVAKYTDRYVIMISGSNAMAAMLKGANDGTFNFVKDIKEYGEKAKIMKQMFTDNGFFIVYDKDMGEDIGDGFYFTFCYPGYEGVDLLNELIRYGISAIALDITGSHKQGIRACVALVLRDQFPDLKSRLEKFHADHPVK